jgi:LysM repeat protein
MADRVNKIQDAVEEARYNGVDASQFVASVRRIVADAEGGVAGMDQNAPEVTSPGWSYQKNPNTGLSNFGLNADPSQGTIPNISHPTGIGLQSPTYHDPKSTNALDLRSPIVMPRSGGEPEGSGGEKAQTERSGDQLTINRTSLPSNERSDAQKAINRTDINTGKPDPALSEIGGSGSGKNNGGSGSGGSAGTGTGTKGSGSGGGNATQTPAVSGVGGGGAMTSGPVSDGGVKGAENGNNSAIGAGQLDKDGYYTVQKGDTLSDIAQRSYGDMNKYQDIAKSNNISNPDVINEGQRIKIDNPTGNGGMSGDVTNPSGSSKAMAGPAVDTSAVSAPSNPASPASGTPGSSGSGSDSGSGVGTAGQPMSDSQLTNPGLTNPPASSAPLAAEAGGSTPTQRPASLRRRATDTNQANSADPNQAADGKAQSTTTTTNTSTKPGASTATTPAKPGATTPATPTALPTQQPGGTNTNGAGTGTGTKKTPEVTPSKSSDTYDPNDPAQNQAQQGTGGSGFSSPSSTGTGFSGSDALSTGLGAAGDIASGLGSALPGIAQGVSQALPGMASGIGNAVSGLASGLGHLFGSKTVFSNQDDFDDFVRYAYPTADGEGKLEPHTHPFAGSGYPGPLEIGTSEEYADKARAKHDDVTDLGDDPLSTPMDKWQRQSSVDDDDFDPYREASYDGLATDDGSDIVRSFQANLDDTALGAGGGGGGGRYDDFASAAQGFLRTAGRNYSLAEQSELIREGDKGGAGNLKSLDLSGTHYEDMNTLGW